LAADKRFTLGKNVEVIVVQGRKQPNIKRNSETGSGMQEEKKRPCGILKKVL